MSFMAFWAGNYARSAGIGLVFGLALVVLWVLDAKMNSDNERIVREMREQELEDAKYPVQTFLRPTERGADTDHRFSRQDCGIPGF